MPMERWILVHKEMGIFLGSCMGMGFWSKLDAAGQEEAVTFDSFMAAAKAISEWGGEQEDPVEVQTVFLEEPSLQSDGAVFMTIADAVRNGLPEWLPTDHLEEID